MVGRGYTFSCVRRYVCGVTVLDTFQTRKRDECLIVESKTGRMFACR